MAKLKIKKGDQVVVTTGRDKGKKGEVVKAIPDENKVVVKGINTVKRHRKASAMGAGGIENVDMPIHISNVAIADPKTGKPSRVGYKEAKDGKKVRFAKASGEMID